MNTKNIIEHLVVIIDLPEEIISELAITPDELPPDPIFPPIKWFGIVDIWNIRNLKRNTGINRNRF